MLPRLVPRSASSSLWRVALLMSVVLAASSSSAAGEELPPTRRVSPDYPRALIEKRIEGWAAIAFRITPEGKVKDAFVSDSSGELEIERSVLKAVEKWRYPSASFERCGIEVQLSMLLGARKRPRTGRAVARFEEALGRSDLAGAREELAAFTPHALAEVVQRDVMRARLAAAGHDLEQEGIALERATRLGPSSSGALAWRRTASGAAADVLGYDALLELVRWQVRALVTARQYGRAAQLAAALGEVGALTPDLADAVTRLGELARSSGRIETPGRTRRLAVRVDGVSHWNAPLLRDRFRVSLESGALHRIDVCCARNSLAVEPGAWAALPAGANSCRLLVRGDEGARFTLVELPNEPAQATPAP